MKKIILFFLLMSIGNVVCIAQSMSISDRLAVSENGHYFIKQNGNPFFWLGETAWHIFSSLTKEEIIQFLNNRQAKGFNVFQCVVAAEFPTRNGELPYVNFNPSKPNDKYFQLVDFVIKEAEKRDMYIALLPTWGHSVANLWETRFKEIFNEKNAYDYGRFLGARYKNTNNIIWVTGGDRPAYNDTADWRPIYRSMVKGIKAGGSVALITYHSTGESSSSDFWQKENILDFNMLQSGHRKQDLPAWEWIYKDYNLYPPKPTIDAEPNYEDHPVFWKPELGYFTDYDVRKQLYRTVFAGAAGVTYGHQSIWQFYRPGQNKKTGVNMYWYQALDKPGAFNAGILKKFMEKIEAYNKIPSQPLIVNNGDSSDYAVAFLNKDSSKAAIYLPVGKSVEVNTHLIQSPNLYVWWMNPKNGTIEEVGNLINNKTMQFASPTVGYGNDWVLIVENAEKNYIVPDE